MNTLEKPEIGILLGDIPLTPIQKWFFNQKFSNIHYFNQAILLDINGTANINTLKTVFTVLYQYHDIFRTRYRLINEEYTQTYVNDVQFTEIIEIRINNAEELYIHATSVHSSLSIIEGPILKVVLYRCWDNIDRLLIVAHHLIIDGISWRILVEDLETIHASITRKDKIRLPVKTYSYRQWAVALDYYANSAILQNEISYWDNIEKDASKEFFKNDSDSEKKEINTETIYLSYDETINLIYDSSKKYNSQINEILLTALTLSIGDITDNYEFGFLLEGHGREDVLGLDVSRTIGWFTSIFPVFLKISDSNDLTKCIEEVKRTLSTIPNKGIGYGVIKYNMSNVLIEPFPTTCFNYLGQWHDPLDGERFFKYSNKSSGRYCDIENSSHNNLEINGAIKNFIFELEFSYKRNFYKPDTIKALGTQFKKRLLEIIID